MKNVLKKAMCIMLGTAVAASFAVPSFAEDSASDEKITVMLNGEEMNFDVEPIIENDRTLVPFRAIFEALDGAVSYSQYSDGEHVAAKRGGHNISLEIGKPEIVVNGEAKTLDVAPKIVNDRTLVPLRAVSESLDCTVDWDEATKTVKITREQGDLKIKSGRIEKTLKNENGDTYMTITAVYPIIDESANSEFIKTLNKSYFDNAEKFVADFEKDAEDISLDIVMTADLTYDVNYNSEDMLSITEYTYYDLGGAHPNYSNESKTYQISLGKELALTDIFECSEEEAEQTVYDSFISAYKDDAETPITDEIAENIKNEVKNVEWYVTADSIVLYFNPYQVGPYAFGMPAVEIPLEADEAENNTETGAADDNAENTESTEGNAASADEADETENPEAAE